MYQKLILKAQAQALEVGLVWRNSVNDLFYNKTSEYVYFFESFISHLKNVGVVGIRSKISRMLNIVSRDKWSNQDQAPNAVGSSKTETDAGSFSVDTESLNILSRSDGFLNTSIVRPLEVPKLEVTTTHNQELIRKYEKRYSLGNNENTKPPALPPRRNSKQVFRFKIS